LRRDPRALLWDIAEAAAAIDGFIAGLELDAYAASTLRPWSESSRSSARRSASSPRSIPCSRRASAGEFVRQEILAELQLSVTRAAEVLGVRRATLSDLVNGHAALSPEMALRIEKAFGVDMDMLLRMQAWHDAYTMRQRADEIDVRRYDPSRTQPA
jgi:addiction module HigA family antidote